MTARLLVWLGAAVVGGASLIGVAVPRLMAQDTQAADRDVIRSIVRVGGAQIGTSVRDVTDADASAAKLTSPSGAYVQAVTPGGPAATAGFRTGDIVVMFDGERVRGASHLVRLVGETPEGRAVEAVVQRTGQRVTLKVTPAESAARRIVAPDLSDLQDRLSVLPQRTVPEMRLGTGRLGATVQELTGQLATYFGVADGVLVTSVTSGSPGATAGLMAGDVITNVDGAAVESTLVLGRRLAQASGEMTVTVMRDRKELTLKVTVARARPAPRTTI